MRTFGREVGGWGVGVSTNRMNSKFIFLNMMAMTNNIS